MSTSCLQVTQDIFIQTRKQLVRRNTKLSGYKVRSNNKQVHVLTMPNFGAGVSGLNKDPLAGASLLFEYQNHLLAPLGQ